MKVLLDENLDHRLRKSLTPHEVFTASYMGFDGLKNGSLLRAVEDGGFDVLVTGDQSLYYEQNLVGRRLAVVVLSAVQFAILGKYLSKIVQAVDNATPGSFQAVDCGAFSCKKLAENEPLAKAGESFRPPKHRSAPLRLKPSLGRGKAHISKSRYGGLHW